jgi:hypothetical protein
LEFELPGQENPHRLAPLLRVLRRGAQAAGQ